MSNTKNVLSENGKYFLGTTAPFCFKGEKSELVRTRFLCIIYL